MGPSSSRSNNNSSNGHNVPPQLPPVVLQMLPFTVCGACLMQGLYMALYYVYNNDLLSLPVPSAAFCQSQQDINDKCGRPDLFAFQMVSGITFILCGGLAFYAWHISKRVHTTVPSTPEGRLFGYVPEAKWVAVICTTYQAWDFAISLTIPEHCTFVMMTHHAVAFFVCLSALHNCMLGYYATFFLGLSEVSSIFLVMLDLCKYFQPQPGSWFEFAVEQVAGPCFVVCFVYYRVLRWWPTSKLMYDDIQAVVKSGRAELLRPGRTWILYFQLILNIPMGLLQLYWLTIIVGEVQVVLAAE